MTEYKDKKYLIYDESQKFYSFCLGFSPFDIISSNPSLGYIEITNDIYNIICNGTYDSAKLVIDIDSLEADHVTILDDEKYLIGRNSINIRLIQNDIIKNIKNTCGKMIDAGLYLMLSDGTPRHYTYKLEDQINLKSIIDNLMLSSSNVVYYHPSGGNYEKYSSDTIQYIYKKLEDYKNYNLIYTDVLCEWIINNYTVEDYNNKNMIMYGYSNDEILAKVGELYGSELL